MKFVIVNFRFYFVVNTAFNSNASTVISAHKKQTIVKLDDFNPSITTCWPNGVLM